MQHSAEQLSVNNEQSAEDAEDEDRPVRPRSEESSIPPADHPLPEAPRQREEGNPEANWGSHHRPIESEGSSSDLEKQLPREIEAEVEREANIEGERPAEREEELHHRHENQSIVEAAINEESFASTSAIFRALRSEERRQQSPPSLAALQEHLSSLLAQISQDRLAASQFAQDVARSAQEKIGSAIASKSRGSYGEVVKEQREIKAMLVELTKKMAESEKKVDRLDKKVEQLMALLRERKK